MSWRDSPLPMVLLIYLAYAGLVLLAATSREAYPREDINRDGQVNVQDVQLVVNAFLEGE